MKQRYEHTTSSLSMLDENGELLPGIKYEHINYWQEDGWELCGVVYMGRLNYEYYWKRKLKNWIGL